MMEQHNGYLNVTLNNPVVTMGIFDGVHMGHRMVLEAVRKRADECRGEAVVITFYPHPRQVLQTGNLPAGLLSTPEEKAELVSRMGIDHLITISFDHEFSNKEACLFIEEVLAGHLGTKHLITGFNHHFGRKGEGSFETIRQCADRLGISVEMVDPFRDGKINVSSSEIREALLSGRLDDANRMLGYCYMLTGKVVSGKKLGRKIGWPTANIEPLSGEKLVPANGVYAVEVILNGEMHKGVMSIGFNPTVESNREKRSIEVNIFDFDGEIYNHDLTIVFRHRLRDELYFDNVEDLAVQIDLDKRRAIELLK